MTLQEQAENIVNNLALLDILSGFGEVHLVGNVVLGVTTKRDVDIQIYSMPKDWLVISSEIVTAFEKLGINDYITRELKQSGKHLTSFAYIDKNNQRWTIDITQTEPNEDYLKDAYSFYLRFGSKFTPEAQETIKSLKQYFLDKNLLHNSMSYYIYRAVIDENAKSPEDIYDYLQRNNINLERFTR